MHRKRESADDCCTGNLIVLVKSRTARSNFIVMPRFSKPIDDIEQEEEDDESLALARGMIISEVRGDEEVEFEDEDDDAASLSPPTEDAEDVEGG